MANSHKVKIAARLRPRLKNELDDEGVRIVRSDDGPSCICVTNPRDASQVFRFPFTSCYDHNSTQEDIFSADVQPLIDVVYSGVTVTIFAYGVTSSGKTHTMQGTKAEPGVIPRVVRALFDRKSSLEQEREQERITISASYMEIYKDEVYDLLVDRDNAPKLPVRENDAGQVFVANLSSVAIESAAEFDHLFSIANKQRSVGATLLNRASSRSHAMVTLDVKMTNMQENRVLTGKINLVDLAGSENNKLTGNDPSRMQESAAINKSLSVLGQVVHALNQNASRIPYRNSKLTRILQDALGGNSVGLLICNLAPGLKFRQDTLNTLNFAVRTKNVENKPVVNERDNRPAPKPHFAAIQAPAPAGKPAALPAPIVAGPSSRPSIIPAPRNGGSLPGMPSRVPRGSAAGGSGSAPYPGASKRRESGIGIVQSHRNSLNTQLSEKEINERISKAVEQEVARRLDAKERERLEEEERRARERAESEARQSEQPAIPSGLLTPLLKRHQDLDNELRRRLQDLEKKYERGNTEVSLKDAMSPVSRKKTGRAYVALARSHSEKGDLQVALDLYRKAETYVPDNVKLKERIIEIEWAVKHGKPFQPSPKKPRKAKAKKRKGAASKAKDGASHSLPESSATIRADDTEDDDVVESLLGDDAAQVAGFGVEVTNSPTRRGSAALDEDADDCMTPRKPRKGKRRAAESDDDDEWQPSAPSKKGKGAGALAA